VIELTTDCFYVLQMGGEAAEYVTGLLSEGAMADIAEAVLISKDFKNDIQATISLDSVIDSIKSQLLEENLTTSSLLNPLYIPSSAAAIDEMLDSEGRGDGMRFKGMGGSPFILKSIDVSLNDVCVIDARVECKPFDLPGYTDIIRGQTDILLN